MPQTKITDALDKALREINSKEHKLALYENLAILLVEAVKEQQLQIDSLIKQLKKK